MVSKTLASLDAWLELAEEVLAEQDVLREKGREPEESDGFDQLSFYQLDRAGGSPGHRP